MTLVCLEPAAPRSRVKHSTNEPLRSLKQVLYGGVGACYLPSFEGVPEFIILLISGRILLAVLFVHGLSMF